ncbi:MAG TPA: hypothetical protein PL066_02435 [bacterium]|nr:hypothetical protein [bacterium]
MADKNALEIDKNIKALRRQAEWIEKKEARLQTLHRSLWLLLFVSLLGLLAAAYFVFIDYYLNGKKEALYGSLLQTSNATIYQQQLNGLQAQNLRINANYSLLNYKGNHDLVSFLYNPNDFWYAEVEYYFQGSGATSEKATAVILPKSTRPIWLMDQAGEAWQSSRVVLENILWKRATNYPQLKNDYLNFSFDKIAFVDVEDDDAESAHTRLNFEVTNNSVFNFWELGLGIVLKRYDEVIAFYYLGVPRLAGLETRPISINLFDEFRAISDTEIIPILNVFDPTLIYRK